MGMVVGMVVSSGGLLVTAAPPHAARTMAVAASSAVRGLIPYISTARGGCPIPGVWASVVYVTVSGPPIEVQGLRGPSHPGFLVPQRSRCHASSPSGVVGLCVESHPFALRVAAYVDG